jgi:uncharacterized damage-inducible protein DinB
MPRAKAPVDLRAAILQAFATNERLNQYLLEHLPPEAWRAEPPGGKGRTVADIAAHMHNVRHMWLKAQVKGSIPDKVDRHQATVDGVRRALAASHRALAAVIEEALAGGGRVKNHPPDVVAYVGYLITHDAHHRGQISMLARQAGHALPQSAMFGMWEWSKRSQET